MAGRSALEVRAFRGDLARLARELDAFSDTDRAAYFGQATRHVADLAAELVDRAADREPDPLTRRIGRAWTPTAPAESQSGGLLWADVRVGGALAVPASGRPLLGQVLYGSEFGGQRRAYRQDTTGRGRKRGRLQGYTVVRSRSRGGRNAVHRLSAGEQRALLKRGGRTLKQTTQQFRPWRARGYWVFPTLDAAADQLLDAWGTAYDRMADTWGRGG